MATLSNAFPTLLDVARRMDPNGAIAKVAEILSQYNEVLDDVPWLEGNMETGHKTVVRSSIPVPTWRLLNKGVQQTKSTTNSIIDQCGMLEAYSTVDVDVANLNGNTAEWRASEDSAFLEGINQELCATLIYGDTSVTPEKFVGLAPRYWTFTTANSAAAGNVINAGGSGSDNASVWLVAWGPQTVYGIYPKGSKAGLTQKDLGEQTVYDASNNPYQAYRTHYQWKPGLVVRDWRYVVRICNIDISDLKTSGDGTDTSTNLFKWMSMALDKLPPSQLGRPVFYAGQTVRAMLRVKLISKNNLWLDLRDMTSPGGIQRPTLFFQGYPVRRIDQLLENEAALT